MLRASQGSFRSARETTHMRVMVVDDEPAVRAALEPALKLEGYSVSTAENRALALRELALAAPTRSSSIC